MLLCAISFCGAGAAIAGECSDDFVSLRGDFGEAQFSVALADTPAARSRGLMFVREMAPESGMLFVYEAPRHAQFWMRNTLIPLDMIFADSRGVVSHVHPQARPLDETVIDGGQDVLFVLEINGGLARSHGITVGAELRHPLIGANAAWPCD